MSWHSSKDDKRKFFGFFWLLLLKHYCEVMGLNRFKEFEFGAFMILIDYPIIGQWHRGSL